LHAPGQLCVYPIVSLARLGWSVGEFMRRFQNGLQLAFDHLIVRAKAHEGRFSLGGRAGVLAAMGVSVQNWVTCHGAFINVNPPMARFSKVDTLDPDRVRPGEKATMTSLLAERRVAVTMTNVRSALVAGLAEAFACSRHHIYTQHPLLSSELEGRRESTVRAS
jgi:lipoate-protein ligase B